MSIKRAVSLYSFQDEYCRKRMDLDEIFSELESLGVEGVELISDQMIKGTPFPSEEELKKWDEVVARHKVIPVINDIFINTTLYNNRKLTDREAADLLIAELKLAKRLGFPMVRMVSMTPVEIVKLVLPTAQELQVVMALEIHAAMSFDNPSTKAFCDYMKEVNSPYLGLVVDTGIFCRKHPRVSKEYFLSLGLNPEVAAYIDGIFEQGSDPLRAFENGMPKELTDLFRSEQDHMYAIFSDGYENCDYSILDEYMPYIKHIHGKCFEFTEDGEEYSINFTEIVEYLDAKGYDGYIATEYEGNRFVPVGGIADGLTNVRAHQALLKKAIDNLKSGEV